MVVVVVVVLWWLCGGGVVVLVLLLLFLLFSSFASLLSPLTAVPRTLLVHRWLRLPMFPSRFETARFGHPRA